MRSAYIRILRNGVYGDGGVVGGVEVEGTFLVRKYLIFVRYRKVQRGVGGVLDAK